MSHDGLKYQVKKLISKEFSQYRLFTRMVGLIYVKRFNKLVGPYMTGKKGQCDLYLLKKGGKHIELELKVGKDRLKKEQKMWRDFCKFFDIDWFEVRDDVKKLRKFLKDID